MAAPRQRGGSWYHDLALRPWVVRGPCCRSPLTHRLTERITQSHSDASQAEQQLFENKLATLAAVIDQQQPDVLALQEIGPDGALETLLGALTTPIPHPWPVNPAAAASASPSSPVCRSPAPHRSCRSRP